jgi:hypothetical protein
MPKIIKCNVDNCPCAFHKTASIKAPKISKALKEVAKGTFGEVEAEIIPPVPKRPRGRPTIVPIDEEHNKCRICSEIKEMSEMRKGRNDCIECYNKSQRNYYQNNDVYKKYKIQKAIEQKKKLKKTKDQLETIEEIPQVVINPADINYII